MSTGQNIDYEIIGIGEEPIAEVYKFAQLTQEKKTYSLKIPYTKPKKYQISKFTLQDAQYEKSFYVGNENSNLFKF